MNKHTIEHSTIYVDAGMIWIGDPCYVMGGTTSTHGVKDMSAFCRKLEDARTAADEGDAAHEPLGRGIGLAISSGYGDGEYPVEIVKNHEGRVARVTITFIGSSPQDTQDDIDRVINRLKEIRARSKGDSA